MRMWLDTEIKYLIELRKSHTWQNSIKMLNERFGRDRTVSAAKVRLDRYKSGSEGLSQAELMKYIRLHYPIVDAFTDNQLLEIMNG